MDNRLRVERDELQFAESERERLQQAHQSNFTNNIDILRRRSLGEDTSLEEAQAAARITEGIPPAEPSEEFGQGKSDRSTRATSSEGAAKQDFAARKLQDKDNSFRHGAVTLCNLKQAERDLADTLKKKKTRETDATAVGGRGYWGVGAGSLGTGPHINLFEEAELAVGNQQEQHKKQIKYLERNNELLEKSQKRPISEFDEIIADVPWYARVPTASSSTSSAAQVAFEGLAEQGSKRELQKIELGNGIRKPLGNLENRGSANADQRHEESEDEEVRSASGNVLRGLKCLKAFGEGLKEEDKQSESGKSKLSTSSMGQKRMKWTKSHGQNVLRIIDDRIDSDSEDKLDSLKTGKEDGRQSIPEPVGVVDCYPLDLESASSSDSSSDLKKAKKKKNKKGKKDKKEKSSRKAKDKKNKNGSTKGPKSSKSLEDLRVEREQREKAERGRADRVLRGIA